MITLRPMSMRPQQRLPQAHLLQRRCHVHRPCMVTLVGTLNGTDSRMETISVPIYKTDGCAKAGTRMDDGVI